jgi:DeoR/GlpR family transcriptional regulator of sugar metabolism
MNAVDIIITDKQPNAETRAALKKATVKTVIAK